MYYYLRVVLCIFIIYVICGKFMYVIGLDYIIYRYVILGYKVFDIFYIKVVIICFKLLNCLVWSLINFFCFML